MKSGRLFLVLRIVIFLFGLGIGIRGLVQIESASVVVEWSTASELDTAGYFLYRSTDPSGPFVRVHPDLISASPDPLTGGSYKYSDPSLEPWQTYYYELEAIGTNGSSDRYGPIVVKAQPSGMTELALAVFMILVSLVAQLTIWARHKEPNYETN